VGVVKHYLLMSVVEKSYSSFCITVCMLLVALLVVAYTV
jgi:hypothetical protein